jgi:alkylhydroperoxidase/carboxymuconolactone decarboxylase family protein YurZ
VTSTEKVPIEVLRAANPAAAEAFQDLRTAVETGVLDEATVELILVATLAATRQTNSMTVHAKRALKIGVTAEALQHAIVSTLAAGALFNDVVGALRTIEGLTLAAAPGPTTGR